MLFLHFHRISSGLFRFQVIPSVRVASAATSDTVSCECQPASAPLNCRLMSAEEMHPFALLTVKIHRPSCQLAWRRLLHTHTHTQTHTRLTMIRSKSEATASRKYSETSGSCHAHLVSSRAGRAKIDKQRRRQKSERSTCEVCSACETQSERLHGNGPSEVLYRNLFLVHNGEY